MSMKHKTTKFSQKAGGSLLSSLAALLALSFIQGSAEAAPSCSSTVHAEVVALDQPFFYNRIGAANHSGMIFALRRDVVDSATGQPIGSGGTPGQVRLRPDKRPRPLVLRVNAGGCLTVNFTNLLSPHPVPVEEQGQLVAEQPATRMASFHVMGMQLAPNFNGAKGIASDGSHVGNNASSLADPGGSANYKYYAEHEGTFLAYSTAATTAGEGNGGSLSAGLFGAVQVEPAGAEWYRSQVTAADLNAAIVKTQGCLTVGVAGCTTVNPGHTADGHPIINYAATYPSGAKYPDGTPIPPNTPILKMTDGSEIVHSDLNAIITGPGAGRFPVGTYRDTPVNPDRNQPFREFTVIFHDEILAEQAFPEFIDPVFKFTLNSVKDNFAINYGTGGIGAEILANRKGVGPSKNCVECKYEEFFLSSWVGGDPAMVVDIPANASNPANNIVATKAFYPDDPSNVHHSYINDHVKFRNLHAGPKEHHIFHLHAHQWVRTPDSDNSTYLDSQAIGPGAGFTYEITHNGSGNRNKTVGDSIFHCHFYPHFAQGMWELWRSHDVFESGTQLDADGKPAKGSRALPDGEIAKGTPIPAVVPLPTLAMAPLPGATVSINDGGQAQVSGNGNPGYPFFMADATVAGHRPPTPPMAIVDDGGLPRHIITGGSASHVELRDDMMKTLLSATARQIPELGSRLENKAMDFHSVRLHPSYKPDGTPGNYVTNGLPPRPGAPFADPCIDDSGNKAGTDVSYKAAQIQLDIKFNKAGWHYPQSRILALWEDVPALLAGVKPPEPFFFRANSKSCISYYYTNLIPNVYEKDDFQVRTPTDILGQHIHLVKFDVTSSDGSGNGFNYENGTHSFQEVQERIDAINGIGGTWNGQPGTLQARQHPQFPGPEGLGARTTVELWYADPTLNLGGNDRTLRTVFSHDHFGPSTHQQVGLYAGLVIEPAGSTWRDPETGQAMGSRPDGGPTSWHADILAGKDSYREFLLEIADYQLAYKAGGGQGILSGTPDPANAIAPPAKDIFPGVPLAVGPLPATVCPGGVAPPCPEAVSAADPGTMTINYRNEPIALRVRDPDPNKRITVTDAGGTAQVYAQAAGFAGDLSFAFSSSVSRADPVMNDQPTFYPPLTQGVLPLDPFTPLMRAYEGDKVQVRLLMGAHEETHNVSVNGVKWLAEPSEPNSGYRGSQILGISEHSEFVAKRLDSSSVTPFTDHLYMAGSATDDLWNGTWGLLRIYDKSNAANKAVNLAALPNNGSGHTPNQGLDKKGTCPTKKGSPQQSYDVTAVTAQQALPGGTLVYNARGGLNDPAAILFVRTADLDASGKLKAGVPVEPLILRAAAGDCINVTLRNKLPATLPNDNNQPGYSSLPGIVPFFNANQLAPSSYVGLHPQMVEYFMVSGSDGMNAGLNPPGAVAPGGTTTYQWYAGDVSMGPGGPSFTPIEFGAINLSSSDPIKHSNKGAIGALIIEPQGSKWVEDVDYPDAKRKTRDSATVTKADGTTFRDFVLLFQDDINLRRGATGAAVPTVAQVDDSEDSGSKALNYKTEPMWLRMGYEPDAPINGDGGKCVGLGFCPVTRSLDYTDVLSNNQLKVPGDPETPLFYANAGTPARFRLLEPGGHPRNHVFNLHGHVWQEEPYINGSTIIGNNPLSEYKGSVHGHGPSNHFDAVLQNGAGGAFKIPGDYLYRDQQSFQFDGGLWGILRVE
jgi:hypothetical protein